VGNFRDRIWGISVILDNWWEVCALLLRERLRRALEVPKRFGADVTGGASRSTPAAVATKQLDQGECRLCLLARRKLELL